MHRKNANLNKKQQKLLETICDKKQLARRIHSILFSNFNNSMRRIKSGQKVLLPVSLKEGPDLPRDRPGQPECDPFFREGRGKKSTEARKQKRAAIPDVQKRRESGLEKGCPEHHQEQQTVGSNELRLMKTREKEMLEEEKKLVLERKQQQEGRAAFLAEQQQFLDREGSQPAQTSEVVQRERYRGHRRRRRRRDPPEEEKFVAPRPGRRLDSG